MPNTPLAKLAAKVVLKQIEDRSPADVNAVLALTNFDVTETGDIIATYENGARRVGRDRQFNMSIAERLDEIEAEHPEYFGRKNVQAYNHPPNPFAAGPTFNMTAQMILWRTDPGKAEALAAEAGLKINRHL